MATHGSGNDIHVIVESAYVAVELQRQLTVLTDNTQVHATNGHLFDYKMQDGRITLLPLSTNMTERIRRLDGENIIIATDSDPQGELIAAHIKQLTPNSKHKRCLFNDITQGGVLSALHRFNQNEFEFNESEALKAALLKITNLKISASKHAGLYLTTTGIDICKQFSKYGRLNQVQSRVFQRQETLYRCNTPKNLGKVCEMARPAPAVTRDIVLQNALANSNTSTAASLQESFINGKLSYTRTDFAKLPVFAEKQLSDFTLQGHLIDIDLHIEFASGAPHYALYNLGPPASRDEWLVASQNRTALSSRFSDTSALTFEGGEMLIASTDVISGLDDYLSPKNELTTLLALSKDASISNLELSAERYRRLFYNGRHLNQRLVTASLNIAEKHYPRLVQEGIHASIEKAVINNGLEEMKTLAAVNPEMPAQKKSQQVSNEIVDSIELR